MIKAPRELAVGHIVTIQLDPVRCSNNPFQGKQAKVVIIDDDKNPDGPIGVEFPAWYKSLEPSFFDDDHFHSFSDKEGFKPTSVIHFERNELRIDDGWIQPEISDEQLYNILFGRRMWHSSYTTREPFIPHFHDCCYEGCDQTASLRISVNCWGVVGQHDVCPDHAKFHGKNCEFFPTKKKPQ